MPARPSIAVFLDPPDENWFAMDLVGEMLVHEWKTTLADEVDPSPVTIRLPRWARRVPRLAPASAFQIDCVAGRHLAYPPIAAKERGKHDFFHVVDHSYAQLVNVLPHRRTGVYCHDLDAFTSLFDPAKEPRPAWFRAMQRVTLRGMCSASVVFFSTHVVRDEIERRGLVPASRLVHAPYGISPEFRAAGADDIEADRVLAPLSGRPYLLHVSTGIPRKRLDVLFETFARLRPRFPELFLLKAGRGTLTDAQWEHVETLGIRDRLVLVDKIPRTALASLYRRSKAVLVTSEAEGFGLPVIEGLACGAPVFASDIPVLREVGKDAAIYCGVGKPEEWAVAVGDFLAGKRAVPSVTERLAVSAAYSWANYARTILDAYLAL